MVKSFNLILLFMSYVIMIAKRLVQDLQKVKYTLDDSRVLRSTRVYFRVVTNFELDHKTSGNRLESKVSQATSSTVFFIGMSRDTSMSLRL